jgi:hypothetical protein
MAMNPPTPDKLLKLLLATGFLLMTFPALSWWLPGVNPVQQTQGNPISADPRYRYGIQADRHAEHPRRVISGQRSHSVLAASEVTDQRIAKWRAAVEAQRKTVESFSRADAGVSISLYAVATEKAPENVPFPQHPALSGMSLDTMLKRMVQAQRKVAAQRSGLLP